MFVTIKRDRPSSSRPSSGFRTQSTPVPLPRKPRPLPRKRVRTAPPKPVPRPRHSKPPPVVLRHHDKENRPISVARCVSCDWCGCGISVVWPVHTFKLVIYYLTPSVPHMAPHGYGELDLSLPLTGKQIIQGICKFTWKLSSL